MRLAFWKKKSLPEPEVHEEDATYDILRRIPIGELEDRISWYVHPIKRRRTKILQGEIYSDLDYFMISSNGYDEVFNNEDKYFGGTGWTLKSYEDEIDKKLKIEIAEEKAKTREARMSKIFFFGSTFLLNILNITSVFIPGLNIAIYVSLGVFLLSGTIYV